MSYTRTTWVNASSPFLNDTNLNNLELGLLGAHNRGEIVVACNGASANVKKGANYVCDGTADEVEINAAITDAFASGGDGRVNGVVLVGGRFYIASPILMKAHVQVRGLGLGTSVTSVGLGSVGCFELTDKNHHMTSLRDLTIWGNYGAGGTSHAVHYLQSDGAGDGALGTYFPGNSPDSSHRISNIYIRAFTTAARHGIYLDDNCRDTNVHMVRIGDCDGDGINNLGSDGKFSQVITTGCNVGIRNAGGNNQYVACKSAYAITDGWVLSSSRGTLAACQSQDSGQHGWNLSGIDNVMTGCIADSNSRLSTTAYGMAISADRAMVSGVHIYDRNQTPASPQNRGIDFTGADDLFLTGHIRLASGTAYVNGTPTGYVRVWRVGSTLYSVG